MAPLDMLFDANGTTAYVTFHGSWDRTAPVGYKLSAVRFDPARGQPLAAADSTNATSEDVLRNADDNAHRPDACVRPVGLAWDARGRLFVSSDATGEVYVLVRQEEEQQPGDDNDGSGTPSSSTSASGTLVTSTASATSSHNAAARSARNCLLGAEMLCVTGLVVVFSMVGGWLFTVN